MTLSGPFLKSLLMAASIGVVVPVHAQTPRRPIAAADREAEPDPEMLGVVREWNGGWVGLAVEANAFVLRFYSAEKKPAALAAARAAVRWNPVGRGGTERAVMNADGELLRSPSTVRPPHVFIAWVTLLSAEGDALGTISFDFRELK